MRVIKLETAVEDLRDLGLIPRDVEVEIRPLSGGVSNLVLWVRVGGGDPYVLKQSCEQLRTQAAWYSRLDRIWNEQAALELLASVLPKGTVPTVLFADPANYVLAISHAPEGSLVWKERLLAGETDPLRARQAGEILGTMHAGSLGHPALDGRLSDIVVFDQLRIDPYYRTIAKTHVEIKPRVDALIAQAGSPPVRTFVHGDFSPKNILLHDHGLFVVDFETAHTGDPAFDLGFFLSHLILKAFRAAPNHAPFWALADQFWSAYDQRIEATELAGDGLVARAIAHTSACVMARIDGKSPVDYLDESAKTRAREFAFEALLDQPADWPSLAALFEASLKM